MVEFNGESWWQRSGQGRGNGDGDGVVDSSGNGVIIAVVTNEAPIINGYNEYDITNDKMKNGIYL